MKNKFVGIDLGTTNTVVSYFNDDDKMCTLKLGKSEIIPSVVFFDSKDGNFEDNILIGVDGLKKLKRRPNQGAQTFKRKIGTSEKYLIMKNDSKKSEDIKSILIDTNIFINHSEFYDYLTNDEELVIAKTNYEELQHRAKKPDTDFMGRAAIEKINYFTNYNAMKVIESDEELLPKDIVDSVKTPNDVSDNQIISAALKKKNMGTDIQIVTDDKGVLEKCYSLDLEAKCYAEFIKGRDKQNKFLEFTAEEITSLFLTKLREKINKKLDEDITKAVITYPADFDNLQIEATKRAAKKAGFENVSLLKEPVAAALMHGLDRERNQKIAVYDLGGGTFDFAVIEVNSNGDVDVIVTNGDKRKGGEDITQGLMNYIYELIAEKYEDCDFVSWFEDDDYKSGDTKETQKYEENKKMLRNKAEELKKLLSESKKEIVCLEQFYLGQGLVEDISFEILRADLEDEFINEFYKETENLMNKGMQSVELIRDDIDKIVLAGGGSFIPCIQDGLTGFFGKDVISNLNVGTIISQGATIHARDKENGRGAITDYLNTAIGIKINSDDFYVIFDYKTKLPCSLVEEFNTAQSGQSIAALEIYSRDKFSNSTKITEQGISFLDKLRIGGLENYSEDESTIKATFNITDEGILEFSAAIMSRTGEQVPFNDCTQDGSEKQVTSLEKKIMIDNNVKNKV